MLLTLRSLLWHKVSSITGTCATQQAPQLEDLVGSIPVVATVGGSLPAKRRRAGGGARAYPRTQPVPLPELIYIPAIVGTSASVQAQGSTSSFASLNFRGFVNSYQHPQFTEAIGDVIDVDLEMIAALFMEFA